MTHIFKQLLGSIPLQICKKKGMSVLLKSNQNMSQEELINWINSPEGREALATAIEDSQSTVSTLDGVRKINTEELNQPITV